MTGEKERVDSYLATLARMEPDIAMIDASAFYASAAISLKRIADSLEQIVKMGQLPYLIAPYQDCPVCGGGRIYMGEGGCKECNGLGKIKP